MRAARPNVVVPAPVCRWSRAVAAGVVAVAGLGVVPPPPAAAQQSQGEALVPAVYRQLKDDLGNTWSFQQNGILGRTTPNSLITGAQVLQITGNQFYNHQPLMTPDGYEFVLDNNQQNIGLVVSRRVRLEKRDGVVRYVESLHNPSSTPVTVTVELKSNLGGRFSQILSDRGRANPSTLERRESGVLAVPKNAGVKGLVFVLASPKSKLKPSITHQNEYQLNFDYSVTVPAGQTATVMHTVAQVDVPENRDAKSLAALFREAELSRHAGGLRPEDRAALANYSGPAGFAGVALLASGEVGSLGVDRARSDVLAIGDETRLLGTASCGLLTVETGYGSAEVPFEQVVALSGGNRGRNDVARVFLTDGQVFNGRVEASGLRFVMPSGGKLELDADNLDRLVRAERPGQVSWDGEAVALVETYRGDRIATAGGAGSGGPSLACITPWGTLPFALDEVSWMCPPGDGSLGHQVVFKDGSRVFGFLSGGAVAVDSPLFGPHSFEPHEVRSVVSAAAVAPASGDQVGLSGSPEPGGTDGGGIPVAQGMAAVSLAGGQRLAGRIDAPLVHAVTDAEVIPLQPEAIRSIRNVSEDYGDGRSGELEFSIDLWGGSVIRGGLREPVLPLRVRTEVWQVPVGDIVEISTGLPQVSDASRLRIAELVRQLGSDEWRARDSASDELAEFGYMAAPQLREALRVNPDPEVRRRVERLLEEHE